MQYGPTPEIQTATINWSFKNTEETVKVEVWDVVDKGIKIRPGKPIVFDKDDEENGESIVVVAGVYPYRNYTPTIHWSAPFLLL